MKITAKRFNELFNRGDDFIYVPSDLKAREHYWRQSRLVCSTLSTAFEGEKGEALVRLNNDVGDVPVEDLIPHRTLSDSEELKRLDTAEDMMDRLVRCINNNKNVIIPGELELIKDILEG